MKNLSIVLAFFSVLNFNAQDAAKSDAAAKDTSWKTAGFFGLNMSQTALNNWQGGGQDNIAINAILNGEATYRKGKVTWTNKFDSQYGIVKTGLDSRIFKKNIDQLFALSKLNIDAFAKHWYYAAQVDFRSQMAPGYTYVNDTISGRANSDFCSPGYIQIALGLDYKPASYFSAFLAPAAGKITLVNRQYLADAGAFGVTPAVVDSAGNVLTPGSKKRFEFGGRLVLKFKKDIFKNVNLDSYLDLFSNYTNNPGNIDVVFNNLLTFKINKYITANIISQMIYDDDIIIKRDWDKDGKYDTKGSGLKDKDINGPRLQALSTFAIGFGYKF